MRLLILVPAVAATLGAADFWLTTPPEKWTSAQLRKIMTSSPWARTVTATAKQKLDEGAETDTAGNRSRMGRGGGVVIGSADPSEPTVGLPPPSLNVAVPGEKAIVRWESAAPVREAARRLAAFGDSSDLDVAAHVVVSLTLTGPVQQLPKDAAQQTTFSKWIDSTTTLELPGQAALHPVKIAFAHSPEGSVALFHFARPVALRASGEVAFTCRMWPLTFRARFFLSNMVFHGRLEL